MPICGVLLSSTCYCCGKYAAFANPLTMRRACRACADGPTSCVIDRNKAKEAFLLRDADLEDLPSLRISPGFSNRDGTTSILYWYNDIVSKSKEKGGGVRGLHFEMELQLQRALHHNQAHPTTPVNVLLSKEVNALTLGCMQISYTNKSRKLGLTGFSKCPKCECTLVGPRSILAHSMMEHGEVQVKEDKSLFELPGTLQEHSPELVDMAVFGFPHSVMSLFASTKILYSSSRSPAGGSWMQEKTFAKFFFRLDATVVFYSSQIMAGDRPLCSMTFVCYQCSLSPNGDVLWTAVWAPGTSKVSMGSWKAFYKLMLHNGPAFVDVTPEVFLAAMVSRVFRVEQLKMLAADDGTDPLCFHQRKISRGALRVLTEGLRNLEAETR
jgi:hypothetical protein